MADTLRQFHYGHCTRADKGVLRQYLLKVTGLSRAQVARCITQFTDGGRIKDRRHAPAVPFTRRYTVEDIRLLAEMDALHGTLSGTTTRKLTEITGVYPIAMRAPQSKKPNTRLGFLLYRSLTMTYFHMGNPHYHRR